MSVRVITLCENSALFGFKAEWGLSMFITVDDVHFLLDTGMTDVAVENGVKHEVPFEQLSAIVLSHGHRDHTGGLAHFLKKTGPITVIGHPDVFNPKFSARHHPPDCDISIPWDRESVEAMGGRLTLSSSPVEVAPGIITSGEVPMNHPMEHIDTGLLTQVGEARVNDPLADDLSVAVDSPRGLYIFLGCAHRGPINIINHFKNITGQSRVYLVAGGLHLSRADDTRIAQTVEWFRDAGVEKVACSHCTGINAMVAFKRAYGNDFIFNNSGKRLFFN